MRRKNLRGYARKIFRALDNDVSLKSKHARSGLPPRALITKHSLKTYVVFKQPSLGVCVVFGECKMG